MKYKICAMEKTKEEINKECFVKKCRINEKNFTRKRKVMPADIIRYELNKRGLTSKMEIRNFNKINNISNISSPGMFKQREKLNPEAFVYLIQENIKLFYCNSTDEVKTYKGYVLTGIDGSDFEIPNTPKARKNYNGKLQNQCARVTISTSYDLINKYTLDTIVEEYNYSEIDMLKRHNETIDNNGLLGNFNSITIADRNYKSLSLFYYYTKQNKKFLIRTSSSVYKKEKENMTSNDEIIEISYEYNRAKYYKDTDPEIYEYLKNGNTIKLRCVKINLDTEEIEYLLTNLDAEEFSYEEINYLYNLRWKIETNYKHLKNNLKIECITSSKPILIKQDIYSQVLVANLLQAFINDSDESLKNYKHKHKAKTNKNMAIGIFKDTFIYILLENDGDKRSKMMDDLIEEMEEYIIYEIPNRKNERKNNPKNRYNINQRKSF